MAEDKQEANRRSKRNVLSTLMFVVAAGLLAFAAYSYWDSQNSNDDPPPPPSVPGKAELKNVHDFLVAEGLDVGYGKDGARIENITSAGQLLTVDGEDLYVFIFANPQEREQELAGIDTADLVLLDLFGDPLTTSVTHVYQQSNVMAVLVGGDDDLDQQVSSAIAKIP